MTLVLLMAQTSTQLTWVTVQATGTAVASGYATSYLWPVGRTFAARGNAVAGGQGHGFSRGRSNLAEYTPVENPSQYADYRWLAESDDPVHRR